MGPQRTMLGPFVVDERRVGDQVPRRPGLKLCLQCVDGRVGHQALRDVVGMQARLIVGLLKRAVVGGVGPCAQAAGDRALRVIAVGAVAKLRPPLMCVACCVVVVAIRRPVPGIGLRNWAAAGPSCTGCQIGATDREATVVLWLAGQAVGWIDAHGVVVCVVQSLTIAHVAG